MASREDGQRQEAPLPVELVRQFLNTWDGELDRDDLASTDGLADWLAGQAPEAGRSAGPPPVTVTEAQRRSAVRLREALRTLATGHATNAEPDPAALAVLNEVLARTRVEVRFGADAVPSLAPVAFDGSGSWAASDGSGSSAVPDSSGSWAASDGSGSLAASAALDSSDPQAAPTVPDRSGSPTAVVTLDESGSRAVDAAPDGSDSSAAPAAPDRSGSSTAVVTLDGSGLRAVDAASDRSGSSTVDVALDGSDSQTAPAASGRSAPPTVELALGRIAAVVALAAFDGSWLRLKACPECGWSIYDWSKSRTRSWCRMSECGNRAKARAFRARRVAAAQAAGADRGAGG